jgi:hypothetical protein
LFQLWKRTGGGTDAIIDGATESADNETSLLRLTAEVRSLKGDIRDILGSMPQDNTQALSSIKSSIRDIEGESTALLMASLGKISKRIDDIEAQL